MNGIYYCERCGWSGDEPQTIQVCEEEYLLYCPEGCVDDCEGTLRQVILNPAHPVNQRRYAAALKSIGGGL